MSLLPNLLCHVPRQDHPPQECPVGLWGPFGVPGSPCPALPQRHQGRWSASILHQLQAALVTQL